MRRRHIDRAKVSPEPTTAIKLQTRNPNLSDSDGTHTTSQTRIFPLCLGFRLANALLIQTYFNPDEHWQALEVAHRIAFGYTLFSFLFVSQSHSAQQSSLKNGFLILFVIFLRYGHLTWEWEKGIRSYLHPMLFAVLYRVLAFLGLDTQWFMVKYISFSFSTIV